MRRKPPPLQSSREEGHGKPCRTRPLGVEDAVCGEPLLRFVGKGLGEAGQGRGRIALRLNSLNRFSGLWAIEGSDISDSWSRRYHSGLQEAAEKASRGCGL